MKPRRLCFVTDELFPFTRGGIGRLLHNLILWSIEHAPDVELHLLMPSAAGIDHDKAKVYFQDKLQIHPLHVREGWEPTFEEGRTYAPAGAYTDSWWHARSLDCMRALKALERSGTAFDWIEFTDYGGWAYCTIQEKRLGQAFANTELLIRLHSTRGVLQHFERPHRDYHELGMYELERKSLEDVETLIAHVPTMVAVNQQTYGFNDSWAARVRLEFPPTVYPSPPSVPAAAAAPGTWGKDIAFITKLQTVKHPELFVRGVATFMRSHPEYTGRAWLACHSMGDGYEARILKLIPTDLKDRFSFLCDGAQRDALIAQSLVVIPSLHESLSLAAYEASAAGAPVLLNARCAAFTPGASPFEEGRNCWTFDGTVEGLAQALARALSDSVKLEPVQWKVTPPYWTMAFRPAAAAVVSSGPPSDALVSVVIPNFNLGRYLPETLASISASTHPNIEVIIVDDASTQALDRQVLSALERHSQEGAPVRVIRNPVNRGMSATRNMGIRAARGSYILPLDADDCISPSFIALAATALDRQTEFDVVVPSVAYFQTDEDLLQNQFCDWAMHLGNVPSMGLSANRFGCVTSLIRRSVFDTFQYDEQLAGYEDWDLYLRMTLGGSRFLVTNEVHFFYRRRPESLVRSINRRRHHELIAQLLDGTRMRVGVALSSAMAPALALWEELQGRPAEPAATAPPSPSPPPEVPPPPPLRYLVADRVNNALKQLPGVHGWVRGRAAQASRALERFPRVSRRRS